MNCFPQLQKSDQVNTCAETWRFQMCLILSFSYCSVFKSLKIYLDFDSCLLTKSIIAHKIKTLVEMVNSEFMGNPSEGEL